MKRRDLGLDPELEAFLEHRPIERRAPPELRARALARARAFVAGGGVIPAAPPVTAPAPVAMPAARGRLAFRIALAASLVVAGAAVGAVAALHGRRARVFQAALPQSPSAAPSAPGMNIGGPARESPAPSAEGSAPTPPPPRPARSATKEDPFTAELTLLQRAHAAYTRRDFSVALTLIAEHAHRFPRGHLAEQREALRVRSLAGSGRREEAHRAAAAFAARFPRSVLLPGIEGGSESPEP